MRQFRTFSEFASEETIMKLLSRERAKFAVKNSGTGERTDPIYLEQIKPMMPPRKLWVNPSKPQRPRKGTKGLSAWTYPRKMADARIWATIVKYREKTPDAPWVIELDRFVRRIQGIIDGTEDFKMESPRVLAKFKKEEKGEFIYRPICMYTSLETKIILVLTYKYLLDVLDDCFHGNMLFMRSARRDRDGRRHTPNFMDAIRKAENFRRKHDSQDIYVGECDIQKFYDIFNHDDILECFDRIFSVKASMLGIDVSQFAQVRRIIGIYLDSFDYYTCVMGLNDQSLPMWKGEKARHRSEGCPDPVCRFAWVDDKDFIESGCYEGASLETAKRQGKLGIPQGGALSGIIVNVVMQCIDEDIVKKKDPERLFIRYCDDILLMHTDRVKCRQYLDTYLNNLKKHKLVPHKAIDVSSCKNGVRTHKGFWKAKSKNVYKWGGGDGDASWWVAFVGYEMRRTGEVRIRKDKIDEMFTRIAHKYHQIRTSKKGTPEEKLARFNTLAPKMLDYEMQTRDCFSRAQARHLDKYLERKVGRIASRENVAFPEDLVRFVSVLDDQEEG